MATKIRDPYDRPPSIGSSKPSAPDRVLQAPLAGMGTNRVTLNWKAYFRQFCEAHGGEPVYHQGRLLFRDGWQHSANDYQGPEVSPPSDPTALASLRRAYWMRRRLVINSELQALQHELNELRAVQASRSVPLQQSRAVLQSQEDGSIRQVTEVGDMDWDFITMRIEWLMADLINCNAELIQLTA